MSDVSTQNKPIRFGQPFQRSVVKLMMQDHNFCIKACDLLYPTNFLGSLSWFFSAVKDHFEMYGTMPTEASLSADISKHKIEKQIELTQELNEIMAVDVHPKKIKAEMTDFIRANKFVDSSKKAVMLYNHDDTETAYAFMNEAMMEIQRVDFNEDRFSRFGSFKSDLAKARFETLNAIPTGINAIDDAMGGMLPGTLTVFLGPSNSGKSMLMPTLAYHAAIKGKRVFITIHEDEENPTKLRYLSRFSGIEINRLRYGNLTPQEEAQLEKADALLQEFVVLRFMYTVDATVEHVLDTVRALNKEWPFELFMCDYGQCLRSREYKATEKRFLYEHVYSELKQVCLELNICGASVAQVNRSGNTMSRTGSDFLRMTDVGESFGIAMKASNVITINRSEDDKRKNRVVFLLDKVRNGRCPVAVACVSDYSKATTHSDSVGSQVEIDVAMGPGELDMPNVQQVHTVSPQQAAQNQDAVNQGQSQLTIQK